MAFLRVTGARTRLLFPSAGRLGRLIGISEASKTGVVRVTYGRRNPKDPTFEVTLRTRERFCIQPNQPRRRTKPLRSQARERPQPNRQRTLPFPAPLVLAAVHRRSR